MGEEKQVIRVIRFIGDGVATWDAETSRDRVIRVIRFIGDPGHYLTGIPARDLSPAEWDALSEEDHARALESGLYAIITKGD